jgi:hypothetical protein
LAAGEFVSDSDNLGLHESFLILEQDHYYGERMARSASEAQPNF